MKVLEKIKNLFRKEKVYRGHVTGFHITAGKINDCRRCPVALALQETLDNPRITIGLNKVYHWDDRKENPANTYNLSRDIVNWILEFDEGKRVTAFSFEIRGRSIGMYDREIGGFRHDGTVVRAGLAP